MRTPNAQNPQAATPHLPSKHHIAAPRLRVRLVGSPNTGDSTTAVSEDFIDAVEAQQDAEATAAAAAEELAAEEPPAPRAQRRIDFTAAAASVDGQSVTREYGKK